MRHHDSGFGRTLIGLVIIGVGLLLLFERLGLVEDSVGAMLGGLWPLLPFGIPGYLLLRSSLDYGLRTTPFIFGLALLSLAAALSTANLGLVPFTAGDVWHWVGVGFFPLILILVGLHLLLPENRTRWFSRFSRLTEVHIDDTYGDEERYGPHGDEAPPRVGRHRSVLMGELRLGQVPFTLEDMTLSCLMGSIDLDLTRALIPEGETAIRASVTMGEIQIFLPRDLAVRIDSHVQLGDADVLSQHVNGLHRSGHRVETPNYAAAERRVHLILDVSLGSAEVRSL